MDNKTDETRYSELQNIQNTYKSCCCRSIQHVDGDETPHYCCNEKTSLWKTIKNWFRKSEAKI